MSGGRIGAVGAFVAIVVLAGFLVLEVRDSGTVAEQRDAAIAALNEANAVVGRSERDVSDLEQRLGDAAQELANLRDEATRLDPTKRAEDAVLVEACIIDQNMLINDMLSDRQAPVSQDLLDDLARTCNAALERTAAARAGQ